MARSGLGLGICVGMVEVYIVYSMVEVWASLVKAWQRKFRCVSPRGDSKMKMDERRAVADEVHPIWRPATVTRIYHISRRFDFTRI